MTFCRAGGLRTIDFIFAPQPLADCNKVLQGINEAYPQSIALFLQWRSRLLFLMNPRQNLHRRRLAETITFQDILVDVSWDGPIESGLPVHLVNHLATMADLHRAGRYDRMSNHVLMLTGQGPLSLQEFVRKNAGTLTALPLPRACRSERLCLHSLLTLIPGTNSLHVYR